MNSPSPARPGGYFDLQVNGFAGVDFQSPDLTAGALGHAVAALHAHQTDRILLTLITDRLDALCGKLERLVAFRGADPAIASTIVGFHVEGPFLLAKEGFCGPHDPDHMCRPSVAAFERLWTASAGLLRLLTLAPELPGAAEVIEHAVRRGVRVAIGHSDASERAIDEAIAAGLSVCTHLGNGVPIQAHRHDNIIQRLLARDELFAAFIPDGIHVPPFTLRNFVRAKPPARVLFTTDAMAAAGAPAGRYRIGRTLVEVGADRIVRQPGRENFAGSALTMDVAAANVGAFLGWSRDDAVAACSRRVAEFLGLPASRSTPLQGEISRSSAS